jgi:isocitrate/isopropylmalate dehydrogenase
MATKSIPMPDSETGPQPVAARPWVPVLPGDGIGREVTAEVRRLAEALVAAGRLDAEFEELDWGAERFLASGEAVPAGGFDRLRRAAAVFCGAACDSRVPTSSTHGIRWNARGARPVRQSAAGAA